MTRAKNQPRNNEKNEKTSTKPDPKESQGMQPPFNAQQDQLGLQQSQYSQPSPSGPETGRYAGEQGPMYTRDNEEAGKTLPSADTSKPADDNEVRTEDRMQNQIPRRATDP